MILLTIILEKVLLELFSSQAPDASRSKNESKLKLFVVIFAKGRLVEEFIFTPLLNIGMSRLGTTPPQ